jgi:hypothetical protein
MIKFEQPSDKTPFLLDENCIFYSNYFQIDGRKVFYKDIATILWIAENKKMNGYNLNSKINYMVLATREDYIEEMTSIKFDSFFYACDDFSYQTGLIKTQQNFINRQNFIHNFLYQISRPYRFERSIKSLLKYGYLTPHEQVKVFDNGDLYINNNFEGNFLEKHKEGKLINGAKYGGYKNSISNPYELGFVKKSSFFGIIENKAIFLNISNTDIMDLLLNNLFKNGKLSKY